MAFADTMTFMLTPHKVKLTEIKRLGDISNQKAGSIT